MLKVISLCAQCRHISGISDKLAKNIVERRLSDGPFICRSQLLSIAGLGSKTFEQCAGFLRIMPQCSADLIEGFVCFFFISFVIVVIITTLFVSGTHCAVSWMTCSL